MYRQIEKTLILFILAFCIGRLDSSQLTSRKGNKTHNFRVADQESLASIDN
jgi:hypothetical protein